MTNLTTGCVPWPFSSISGLLERAVYPGYDDPGFLCSIWIWVGPNWSTSQSTSCALRLIIPLRRSDIIFIIFALWFLIKSLQYVLCCRYHKNSITTKWQAIVSSAQLKTRLTSPGWRWRMYTEKSIGCLNSKVSALREKHCSVLSWKSLEAAGTSPRPTGGSGGDEMCTCAACMQNIPLNVSAKKTEIYNIWVRAAVNILKASIKTYWAKKIN